MGQLSHHSGWIKTVAVSTKNAFIYTYIHNQDLIPGNQAHLPLNKRRELTASKKPDQRPVLVQMLTMCGDVLHSISSWHGA
jgi:hypothetical protein